MSDGFEDFAAGLAAGFERLADQLKEAGGDTAQNAIAHSGEGPEGLADDADTTATGHSEDGILPEPVAPEPTEPAPGIDIA